MPGLRFGARLTEAFQPTRSMRRIRDRNKDLIGEMRVATPTSEQYSVFRSYLIRGIATAGMADMTVLDFAMMVEDSQRRDPPDRISQARPRHCHHGRGTGELIAVALTDVLSDGLSMVYSSSRRAKHPVRSAPS